MEGRRLAGGNYDYKTNNGEDWPLLSIPNKANPPQETNECGKLNSQSPIDLPSSRSDGTIVRAEDDNFNKMYYNQVPKGTGVNRKNVNIKWVGDTSKTVVQDNADLSAAQGTTSFFYSDFGNTIGGVSGGPTQYGANQFHFHTGSEHTIDGKRHDLEMHTVHFPKAPKGGIIAAAMGIFFSVEDYDPKVTDAERAIIDQFFMSLKWDLSGDQTSPKVTYGNLMMMVNMRARWSYRGSVTTPPCATTVYWNVVRQIYPIK
jgi:carbonic anhydrase